jgi:hypothetical protein
MPDVWKRNEDFLILYEYFFIIIVFEVCKMWYCRNSVGPNVLKSKYSRTPLIRIKWDEETSVYTENPDNWIVHESMLYWQFGVKRKLPQTAVLGYILIDLQIKYYS